MGSWGEFIELVKVFGLPLAMTLFALSAFYTRRIITRAELDEVNKRHREELAKEEARTAEWKRLAKRGSEIIQPLATTVREQLSDPKESASS